MKPEYIDPLSRGPNNAPLMGRFTGPCIDLVNPKPSDILMHDIEVVLARTPRYGGQGLYPLSVAQHSAAVAAAAMNDTNDPEVAWAALWHDAHEAYMGDITRPVEKALAVLCKNFGGGNQTTLAIQALKARLDVAIFERLGVNPDARRHPIIDAIDRRVCLTEMRILFPFLAATDYGLPSEILAQGEIPEVVTGYDLFGVMPREGAILAIGGARTSILKQWKHAAVRGTPSYARLSTALRALDESRDEASATMDAVYRREARAKKGRAGGRESAAQAAGDDVVQGVMDQIVKGLADAGIHSEVHGGVIVVNPDTPPTPTKN